MANGRWDRGAGILEQQGVSPPSASDRVQVLTRGRDETDLREAHGRREGASWKEAETLEDFAFDLQTQTNTMKSTWPGSRSARRWDFGV